MEHPPHNHAHASDEQDGAFDAVGSIATNVADGFTMVAVGDLIVSRALTKGRDTGFGALTEILRDADATFGNLETNIFDIRSFSGSPQAEYGGAYHVSLPELAPDLSAMGFNLLSRANNHSMDWGVEGMRETSSILDQNGIIHAGVGENLAQAGAPRYLETKRGRVAMVSVASTYTELSRASDAAGEAPGRPGLYSLRLAPSIVLPQEVLEELRRISKALPGPKPMNEDPSRVVFGTDIYEAGEVSGFRYEANRRDVAGILRNVREGKQFGDFCIATNHGHEPGNWSQEPPNYEQALARQIIDAGADAYIVHGPHQLRGIEIYKGRPIFYSLGNFIMDDLRTPVGADMFDEYGKDPRNDTAAEVTAAEMIGGYGIPEEAFTEPTYYESVIAVSRFERNHLAELRLYPIELGHTERFANRGIPRHASAEQARRILERLQKLSEPYGTTISIENNIGIIRITSAAPEASAPPQDVVPVLG